MFVSVANQDNERVMMLVVSGVHVVERRRIRKDMKVFTICSKTRLGDKIIR